MAVDLNEVQHPRVDVYNAGGGQLTGEMLDRLLTGAIYAIGRKYKEASQRVRLRSHPLQRDLFLGIAHKQDSANATGRVEWIADGALSLDLLFLERIADSRQIGRIENLYPSCPVCSERRAEQALLDSLHEAGLLRTGAPRTLIHCEGKSVSETIIEERG